MKNDRKILLDMLFQSLSQFVSQAAQLSDEKEFQKRVAEILAAHAESFAPQPQHKAIGFVRPR